VLDIHVPKDAKDLPVVFWIHGGGWQAGDKTGVQAKPQAFVDKGFVFVSTNYRLLPDVDMGTIVRDVQVGAFRSRYTAPELVALARDREERWKASPPPAKGRRTEPPWMRDAAGRPSLFWPWPEPAARP